MTVKHKEPSLLEALLPILLLVILLAINLYIFGVDGLSGSNQMVLIISSAIAVSMAIFRLGLSWEILQEGIVKSISSAMPSILILFLIGSPAGTWMLSGIVPAMIYYGLQFLSPAIFLVAACAVCCIVSVATGSSWTTVATVGVALLGIGRALGFEEGIIAGAVISGAYFGDKMSPLSDTTNLAPAMAGTDLFTHIRYMTFTTVPTLIVTLIAFSIMSMTIETTGNADLSSLLNSIDKTFNITPMLFMVPLAVIVLILLKTKPLIALGIGVLLAALFSFIYQPNILDQLTSSKFESIINAIFTDTQITTDNEKLNDLFSAGGMKGMLWTIYLICCAMVFGGIMDAIGSLSRITKALLSVATTVFGLFASTVISCLGLNTIASDQYLAIVIPGKMFKKAYQDKGLAPENLSRTLEDSGTVTSVLIPWNTCGAYQSGVLGVGVSEYFVYAIFNWLSPFTTLFFAALQIKIKQLSDK